MTIAPHAVSRFPSDLRTRNWSKAAGLTMSPFRLAILYLSLPNLPPLISARLLGASAHGYINLDYLMIGAVGVFLPRGALLLLLCLESIVAFAGGVCTTFQFSLEDLLSSLRYLPALPWERVLEGIAVVTAGILACL